jgi:formylmethanofuran dehydrogenase subunit B
LGGKVSCTLGEVKNRADLIVYWGGNPAECHPRHFTKYTLTQKGKFVPNGRKDRTMILVDIRETPSVKAADILPPGPPHQGLRGHHHPARPHQGATGR